MGQKKSVIAWMMLLVGTILVVMFIDQSNLLWFIGIVCELTGGIILVKEGIRLKKSKKKENDSETKEW